MVSKLPVFFTVCLLAFAPAVSTAAGFLIYEEGAKALGMGGAFTAQANDASAVFYNPAGMCRLTGTQVYLGGTVIITGTNFSGSDPSPGYGVLERTKTQVFTPLSFYVTKKLSDKLSAGFGFFNPFGLGREWENPESFTGRYISYKVDLKSYFMNPALSWKVNDNLMFGAGLQLVYSSVLFKRYQLLWDPDGSGFLNVARTEIDGNNGLDVGLNGGVLFKISPLTLGLNFRSSVTVDYEGDAKFTQVPSGNSAVDGVAASGIPGNQPAGTRIKFPPIISFGIAFHQFDNWTFEVDLNWVGWSTFDVLPFNFEDEKLNIKRHEDYTDVFSIRTGAEYRPNDTWSMRLGYYFDGTPQPKKSMSPLLPDSDRHGITLGLGYNSGPWTVDVFDLILVFLERDTAGMSNDDYNGTYSSWANLIGVNLGYSF